MPMPSSTDLADCQASLQTGSRSFHLASFLLPRRIRQQAAVLYAFCREADDLIDQGGGQAAVEQLRGRVDGLAVQARGRDRLLAELMASHQIPGAVLHALLDGFAQDVEHTQPANMDALLDYAVRVAGTVGLAMALVMGVRQRAALQAALALGVAMQISNICRDVGEDAGIGRVYLPRDWLFEAGWDGRMITPAAVPEQVVAKVLFRLLALADQFYALADQGMAELPAECRTGILAARRLYAGIGHAVRSRGTESLRSRTVLGPWSKLRCLVQVRAELPVAGIDPWCLAALERSAAGLLQACAQPAAVEVSAAARQRRAVPASSGSWALSVIDLFERLERRALEMRAAPRTPARGMPGLDMRS